MNLGELKTQFLGLANRRDLTANPSLAQTFIDQAVMRIQRELRCPAMEKNALVTITAPYSGLIIPNDFIELINLIPSESNDRLDKVDITKALKAAENVGCPVGYARQGGLWVLGPQPALATTIRIDYYAELSPLVNSTDTNVISIVAWDLIVYAALVQAAAYYKDNRKDLFEEQYQTILNGLQGQADEDELSGAAEVQSAYSFDCE
jgi:hypothetical protein